MAFHRLLQSSRWRRDFRRGFLSRKKVPEWFRHDSENVGNQCFVVLMSFTGTSKQNLENLSMIDTIYRFPDLVVGNGPQISIDIISNGYFRDTDLMELDLKAVSNGFRPPLTD